LWNNANKVCFLQFAFSGWRSLKIKLKNQTKQTKKTNKQIGKNVELCKIPNLMLEASPQTAVSVINVKASGKQLHNSPA